jgi:La-related protein 7
MAPARSSSITAAGAAAAAVAAKEVTTEQTPSSVAPIASVAAVAPAMGAIAIGKKVAVPTTGVIKAGGLSTTTTTTSTSSSTVPAGSLGKSDVVNSSSSLDQGVPPVSETFVRSLSGSKLSAEAPEFVPKGIPVSPAGLGLVPTLISQRSFSIPGVIPVQFAEPHLVSVSQLDSSSSIATAAAATSPPVVTVAATSPPLAPESDHEGFSAPESSPPETHATVPAHAPHPKPVVTEELKAKIVKQVEFYFSDQNLPTDNYLMKFVKKDPDGFVPIPVVASFRKVKNLAKNHGVVAAALRNSTQLVVSDDGKKVRRAQPLPDVDLEEVQSRTVVAENLPEDHSIESLEQLFSSVGNVKMVRICQPEAANGANQTAAKFKSDMVVSNKLHALVEFETLEQAEKAVVALTDKGNWRSGLRVRLLLRRTFHSKHVSQKCRKAGGEESGEDDENGAEDKSWDDFGQHYDHSEEAQGHDATGTADRDGGKKGKGRGRGRGAAGRGKGQHGGHHHVGSNGSRNHQLGTSPQSSHSLTSSEVIGRPPPGPRMPDGTRGFTLGRGKVPILSSA